jgi:hypothetical protein
VTSSLFELDWSCATTDRRISTERAEGERSLEVSWDDYASYNVQLGERTSGAIKVLRADISEHQAALGGLISVLPLALPLFDLEPLHGASVSDPSGEAVLLLGDAGVGKSTVAAGLRERGYPLLADDACAVDVDGNLYPGPPLIAVRRGTDADEPMVYADKAVEETEPYPQPRRVGVTLVLERSPGSDLVGLEVTDRDAFSAVLSYARAPSVFSQRRRAIQLAACAVVAMRPVINLRYDAATTAPARVVDEVEHLLERTGDGRRDRRSS